ncbi:MAG: hypothetical protein ACM3JG_20800 [Thiohalocapsa sp.]
MPAREDVVTQIDAMLAAASRAGEAETTQNYDALAQELNDLGQLAYLTCEMSVDHAALVRKLRSGDTLTPDEMQTVRLLIVGDADYYLKYDEEFERCRGEVKKIVNEIERFKTAELGTDALMHVSTLCREAANLLALAQHYLEARERVRRFETATAGPLDRETASELAHVIEAMFGR